MEPENRAVLSFLMDAVAGGQKLSSTELQEFEDCKYFLSISKNGKIVVLAFSSPAPLSQAALEAVYQEYDDVAQPGYTENYQITLQVSLTRLQDFEEKLRMTHLRKLSRIRLQALGFALRQSMRELAGSSGRMDSFCITIRPNAFFLVQSSPDNLTVLFPIWLKQRQNDLLTMAFAQEFSEARRASGLSDAAQCHVTHPGQAPPVQLSREQRQLLGEFTGGFLTLVVEPRHCSSPEGVENMIWMLLTFYSYLDLQVKSFKALIHSRMRQNANQLLASMEAARANPQNNRRIA